MLKGILLAVAAMALIAGAAQAAGVMMVHHEVADYAKWRPVFDADIPMQQAAGLTNPRVYQSADDPNNVTVVFDMADAAQAKAFGSSQRLKDAMAKGGVEGKPMIYFLNAAP